MSENTSLFKVFRVLWFPLSLNAMALAAVAVVVFWAGSFGLAMFAGLPEGVDADNAPSFSERADLLAGQFPAEAWNAVASLSWPTASASDPVDHLGVVFAGQVILFFFLWSTFGVAICRTLVLRVAKDEYCPIGDAFSYAWQVKLTGMLYPLAVLLPIAFLLLCNHIAGIVTWIPWIGWVLGILVVPLVLISSVIAVLLGVAGVVSLGFVPAAIATERKGTYDSLGKSINYVFARALPLVLHLTVVWLFVDLIHGLFIDGRLVETVIARSMAPLWADGEFAQMVTGDTSGLSGFQWLCACGYGLVHLIYRLLLWGTIISFVFGAFSSLFLILRKDVDGLDYADVAPDSLQGPGVPTPAPPPEATNEDAPQDD